MFEDSTKILVGWVLIFILCGCGEDASSFNEIEISSTVIGDFQDCANCPEMVILSGGEFLMGNREGYKYSKPFHLPMHRVNINYKFAVSKHEITNRQYNECYADNDCSSHVLMATIQQNPEYLDIPVERVTWPMAQEYVAWLSKTTGKNYRLLSESEWEYVARAGSDAEYWWGDEMLPGYALCGGCGWVDGPLPVNELPMNPFGVQGMNGSVQEWVQDCRHSELLGRPIDGAPMIEGANCKYRVNKGAHYMGGKAIATSSSRSFAGASEFEPITVTGIRVATTNLPENN